LEFKNKIFEVKLSKKIKNAHENFSGVGASVVLGLLPCMSMMTMKFRDLQGSLS
jgi:hypothetical protein